MEEALNEIRESLQTLPSHIREVITHTPWKPKITEIALKYSLTEEQEKSLFMEVLLVLVAILPEEELAENIENELGVSGILAEQLTEEIRDRIFLWIQKLYTEKEKVLVKKITSNTEGNILDIPPPNLPGEIIGEEESPTNTQEVTLETPQEQAPAYISTPEAALVTPPVQPHTSLQEQAKDFFAPQTPQASPTFSFQPNPPQQPISSTAPRTPISQPETTPAIDPKPSFISNKLNQPTKPQTLSPEIPKTYTIDPYREPIE